MAVQNKVTYQSTVDSLAANNSTGGISEADVRTLYKNLSESVKHVGGEQDLGEDPTAWNLGGFNNRDASCTNTTNLSIALSNTTASGKYYLRLENITGDLTLTLSGAGLVFKSATGNNTTLSILASSNEEILIVIKRLNDNVFFWQYDAAASSGISNVEEDTSPTLGGNLNVDGNNLVSANGDQRVRILDNNSIKLQAGGIDALDVTTIGLRLFAGIYIDEFLNEDDFSSDSDTGLATQQSIKAYVDSNVVVKQTATIAVTSAEMLAINTTPKTLVAAQGAGTIIVPKSITVKHTYVSTTYDTDTLVFAKYDSTGKPGASGGLTIASTATSWIIVSSINAATTDDITNKALILSSNTADPETGDGTFEIVVEYSVITI